jgi:hypothetical protein
VTVEELEAEVSRLRLQNADRQNVERQMVDRLAFLAERNEILTNRLDSDRMDLAALGRSVKWLLDLARREGAQIP